MSLSKTKFPMPDFTGEIKCFAGEELNKFQVYDDSFTKNTIFSPSLRYAVSVMPDYVYFRDTTGPVLRYVLRVIDFPKREVKWHLLTVKELYGYYSNFTTFYWLNDNNIVIILEYRGKAGRTFVELDHNNKTVEIVKEKYNSYLLPDSSNPYTHGCVTINNEVYFPCYSENKVALLPRENVNLDVIRLTLPFKDEQYEHDGVVYSISQAEIFGYNNFLYFVLTEGRIRWYNRNCHQLVRLDLNNLDIPDAELGKKESDLIEVTVPQDLLTVTKGSFRGWDGSELQGGKWILFYEVKDLPAPNDLWMYYMNIETLAITYKTITLTKRVHSLALRGDHLYDFHKEWNDEMDSPLAFSVYYNFMKQDKDTPEPAKVPTVFSAAKKAVVLSDIGIQDESLIDIYGLEDV